VFDGEQKGKELPSLSDTNGGEKEKISTMARRASKWSKDTPQRRLFDTLIRQSMSDANAASNPVGDHLHLILPILEATLQVSCDPDLRMGMLALIATMLENPYVAQVCSEREAYGGTMLQRLFLPNAVWRVGRVACSVRKIVTRCISTLLRHRLVTVEALTVLWQEPNNLLNVMKSCLDDDEPLTRQYTSLALMDIFQVMEGKLEMETCMAMYPELLKHLDDSNDDVRRTICTALLKVHRHPNRTSSHLTNYLVLAITQSMLLLSPNGVLITY
jgi:hypothetical protein